MAVLEPVHWVVVTPNMRELLRFIGRRPFAERFYLAGGTALALRLGHRLSVDLDFFSATDEVTRDSWVKSGLVQMTWSRSHSQ
jgi:predicted nucleotidyltransferase component of viral defense system